LASEFQIEVEGIQELAKRFGDLDKDGRKRMAKAINLNAVKFRREVRKSITKRTGRHKKYRRGGKNHWSSSPRRAPNSDTGDLRKYIRITTRAGQTRLGAIVISGAKYSRALEEGFTLKPRRRTFVLASAANRRRSGPEGPANYKVAPRPFMKPMLKRLEKEFVARMKQSIIGIL